MCVCVCVWKWTVVRSDLYLDVCVYVWKLDCREKWIVYVCMWVYGSELSWEVILYVCGCVYERELELSWDSEWYKYVPIQWHIFLHRLSFSTHSPLTSPSLQQIINHSSFVIIAHSQHVPPAMICVDYSVNPKLSHEHICMYLYNIYITLLLVSTQNKCFIIVKHTRDCHCITYVSK